MSPFSEAVRRHWPRGKPVLFRLSCIDRADGGWETADTLVRAREVRARGIDAIDCSSGGIRGANSLAMFDRIGGPHHAEQILADGQADLIAVAREALYDPNWPVHAAIALAGRKENQRQFSHWKPNFGWWLQYREKQQAGRGAAGS